MHLVTERHTSPPPPPEPWVDIATVCEHLGFGRTLVTDMAKTGKIPAIPHKNGKRVYWRFKLSQVDAALMQQQADQQ